MSLNAVGLAWESHQKSRRDSWEQTRLIAYYIVLPYLKNKPTITKFMPLTWDSKSKPISIKPSKERFEHIVKLLKLRDG